LSVVYWNSKLPQNGKSVKERVESGVRVLENGDLGVDLPFFSVGFGSYLQESNLTLTNDRIYDKLEM